MSENKTQDTPVKFRIQVREGVEQRFDPLLGTQTRINPARASRPMSSSPSNMLQQVIAEFKDKDPFGPYEKLVSMVS